MKLTGKSIVAGIVDRKGGLRVVVTDGPLTVHIGSGERAYVLPDKIQEPVPFNEIPTLITKVEQYVAQQIAANGSGPSNH